MLKTACYSPGFSAKFSSIMKYLTLPKQFCIVIALVVTASGILTGCGSGPDQSPLEILKKTLKDAPTYSVVLEDMRTEGTFSKQYFHRYLVVLPDESWKTQWYPVSKADYQQHLDHLGMSLLARKDGNFDDFVAPPGYHFVGDETYGRWRQDNTGDSFWEFYGKYALLSSLFGGWYHPVYRSDFGTYNRYRKSYKPFYGSKGQYGSKGKIVKATRPNFYAKRMSAAGASSSSFSNKVNSKIGRTKTSMRSRGGGSGK